MEQEDCSAESVWIVSCGGDRVYVSSAERNPGISRRPAGGVAAHGIEDRHDVGADDQGGAGGVRADRGRGHRDGEGQVCLVDGTITPCWSYGEHPELWSANTAPPASPRN